MGNKFYEMNATNYYVSTSRLALQGKAEAPSTWQDLYHLLPILRNSLSCTVCESLLTEPFTPEETSCEHHVCRGCKGRTKKLKPTCSWCRDYSKYFENVQLRILLENYKKLCKFIKISKMYDHFGSNKELGWRMKEIIRESEGQVINSAEVKEEEAENEEVKIKEENYDVKCEDESMDKILEEVGDDCEVTPLQLDHGNEPTDEIISSPQAKMRQNTAFVPDSARIIPTFSLNAKIETMANTPKTISLVDHTVAASTNRAISTSPIQRMSTSPIQKKSTSPTQRISTSPTQRIPALPIQGFSTKTPSAVHRTPPKVLPWKPEKKIPSILATVSPKPNGHRPMGKIKREAFILDPFKTKNDIVGKAWQDSGKKSISNISKSENSCPSASASSGSSPDSGQCSYKEYKIKPFIPVKQLKRKSGCRCGNATQCPGKLTCCGQRCPCYVDSLACMDPCKCKGCRNPHRPGGVKVRPHIPNVDHMQVVYPATKTSNEETKLKEQGSMSTLGNGESHAVSIPNILANIPVLNIDTTPNGKSSTWTKSNYKAVFSNLSSVSPSSSSGSPSMSLSGFANGSPGSSLRVQPVSVISVLSAGSIMPGVSPLETSSLADSPGGSIRTSSDGLQLLDEANMMDESEEESSDIDIDVGI